MSDSDKKIEGIEIARHFGIKGDFFAVKNNSRSLNNFLGRLLEIREKEGKDKKVQIVIDYDPDYEFFVYRITNE